jgi:hypothetical protein
MALVASLLLSVGAARADENVLAFDRTFDLSKVTLVGEANVALATEDERAPGRPGGTVLRVHTNRWGGVAGVELPAPGGKWVLSKWNCLYADVKNVGDHQLKLRCRVDNPGKEHGFIQNLLPAGIFVNGDICLEPGQNGTIVVELRRHKPDWIPFELTGMVCKPWGQAASSDPNTPGAIDPANVVDICIYVRKSVADQAFEVSSLRAGGAYKEPDAILKDPAKFFPFIDEFGQYIHRDWPGKIHAAGDLAKTKDAEAKDLADHPAPENWDQYGGWKDGPQLKATGAFYTAKYNGKWWLVDPDGKLFFSHGIDCVTPGEGTTLISGREKYFQAVPARDSEYKDFFSSGRGRGVGPAGTSAPAVDPNARYSFDFGRANLMRKYGADWSSAFADVTHRRLRSWGVNSMGAWSSPAIYSQKKTPYTVTVGGRSKTLEAAVGWWGKFADVFDEDFRAGLRRSMAAQADTTAKDPWCIGYFVGNEMDWGGDDIEMAQWVLSCPATQAAKKVFVEDLKAKYGGIEKFNAAWGTDHASWDKLLENKAPTDVKKAYADLAAFTAKVAETYYKTVREAVKEFAPDRLYLGCRFGGGYECSPIATAAAKYCDVISVNVYRESLDGYRLDMKIDAPILIGEFSFWGLDRGLFNTGGLYTEASPTQAQRGESYKKYVQSALRHPQMVGCQWFKYMDEATTGRGDGENFQFGFLDIADTPYWETIEAARQIGAEMYKYRMAGR